MPENLRYSSEFLEEIIAGINIQPRSISRRENSDASYLRTSFSSTDAYYTAAYQSFSNQSVSFTPFYPSTYPSTEEGQNVMPGTSIVAVRSVALSTNTADAWKAAGIIFARRGRTTEEIMSLGFPHVLNLGKSSFVPHEDSWPTTTIWNKGDDIKPLLYPGLTRNILDDLMPPRPTAFPADVWIKAPGSHGRGKFKKFVDRSLVLPTEWDWCSHLEGQEYRLITVNNKVVQDYLRFGTNGNRHYQWIRMRDVPSEVKNTAKRAAERFPPFTVIAWDMIHTNNDKVYIFEGNTCPGVNSETAKRIKTQMIKEVENA